MTIRQMAVAGAALLACAPAAAQYAPGGYPSASVPSAYAPQYGYDADGQSVESVDVFLEPLSHYGRWLDSRYGRVWAPNVPRDWRPYTIGHWEEGRYGLTWRSDEPFGWAVFHFGRWAFDPAIGWVWSPDTTWGPGWVAWRDSDDVTGWAPLPPQVAVGFAFGSGYGFNDWGYDQWYQPAWVYVPRGHLYARSLRGVYLPYARNRDFWEHTRGVTRYDRIDGQVVNRSLGRGRDARGTDGRDWRGGDGLDWRGGDPRRGPGQRDPGQRDLGQRDLGQRDLGQRDLGQRGDRDFSRVDPRTVPLTATARAPLPSPAYADPRTGYAPPRGFGGRDGFVPGTPLRQPERRAVVPAAGVSAARPVAPLAAPAMIRPAPLPQAAPRPAPVQRQPSPRDRTDERPR